MSEEEEESAAIKHQKLTVSNVSQGASENRMENMWWRCGC
jgi:hypothetical protein